MSDFTAILMGIPGGGWAFWGPSGTLPIAGSLHVFDTEAEAIEAQRLHLPKLRWISEADNNARRAASLAALKASCVGG